VEDLACICTRAEEWVVAENVGVTEGGTLFVVPVHRTDRRVDVDGHRLALGPAPRDHARVSIASESSSSWRTWPKLNICGTQSWSFAPRW